MIYFRTSWAKCADLREGVVLRMVRRRAGRAG